MLAAVPLIDDERAAVDHGWAALDKLLGRVADVPARRPAPRQISVPDNSDQFCPSPASRTLANVHTDCSIPAGNHDRRTARRSSAAASAPLSPGEGHAHDVQAGDTVKVPEVGCPDTPSGSYGGRRDEPVMRPHILAGCGELGPDAGVRASSEQPERKRGKRGQHRLDEGLTAGPVLRSGAVHAMEQLRGRDRSDPYLLIGLQLIFQPPAYLAHGTSRRQAADGAFQVDEDGSV